MTTLYSPSTKGGRVRVSSATLTYASQSAGAQTFDAPLTLPVGATVVGGVISTSVTTGSATVALGITGTTGKYKAAGAVTATNAAAIAIPHAAVLATALAADEDVFVTTASAALPASGTLTVILYYVTD